ncbi:MAG: site-specific integrase [Candidatus Thermoplasmatota archaeon]|jgi:integrase|nr:site-specific integrase [Candidatus Thermoplasmatota archaeon]
MLPLSELNKEHERLKNVNIPDEYKNKIMEFVNDVRLEGLSIDRLYFYAIRLRQIASIMPDTFLSPTKEDIKALISKLMQGKIGRRIKGWNHSGTYSDWGIENYKTTLKKFYKWIFNEEKPECIAWLKPNNHPNNKVKPDNMITEIEIDKIIAALKNPRDRAFVYTLYDSGCRMGELLTLKNKDIEFDEYGAILSVTGKTGYRKVRVIGNSISYLREWQNAHPVRNDPDSWFFCGIESENRGKKLEHANVYKFLRKGLKDAKIERRIYPHLFRHTRATILASRVTEAPLEAQMGWVHGSRMTQTYVHLSGRDQDRAILKAYGIEIKDEKPIEASMPLVCPRCNEPNDKINRFCWKCGMILDKTLTEKKLKEEAKEIEDSLMKSDAVDGSTKKIIETFPSDFKDLILETVLKQIVENPDLKERFQKEMFRKAK